MKDLLLLNGRRSFAGTLFATRLRMTVLFILMVTGGIAAPNVAGLSDRDQAVAIVARHLLESIGTPALNEAVSSRAIRSEAYWDAVFSAAGRAGRARAHLERSVVVVERRPACEWRTGEAGRVRVEGRGCAAWERCPLIPVTDLAPKERERLEASSRKDRCSSFPEAGRAAIATSGKWRGRRWSKPRSRRSARPRSPMSFVVWPCSPRTCAGAKWTSST